MDSFRVLEIKKSVFENNDRQADLLREELKRNHTFLLNLMSSPGSGKTTTLLRTLEALKDELRIGVMEADIDSDVDAKTIADAGVKSIQLHTGGMCHLDASMTEQGLKEIGTKVIPVVASVALAKRLVRSGVDALIAEGTESGGHIGEITTMALVPQIVDAVDVPVIGAGGARQAAQVPAHLHRV